MAHEVCQICGEKAAKPMHVRHAHNMSWNEYKAAIKDKEFMRSVAKAKEERLDKEIEEDFKKSILRNHWFETGLLSRLMFVFTDHATGATNEFRAPDIDLSEFDGLDEAIVEDIDVAEALVAAGWSCTSVTGGHTQEEIKVENPGTPLERQVLVTKKIGKQYTLERH